MDYFSAIGRSGPLPCFLLFGAWGFGWRSAHGASGVVIFHECSHLNAGRLRSLGTTIGPHSASWTLQRCPLSSGWVKFSNRNTSGRRPVSGLAPWVGRLARRVWRHVERWWAAGYLPLVVGIIGGTTSYQVGPHIPLPELKSRG